jgi:hypothetical protein
MATKQFYATGDFKYGTRMLRAGDGPFPMDGPTARLFAALGKISAEKPKAAKADAEEPTKDAIPAMTTQNTGKPKAQRTPRKRVAKKAK